MSSFESVLESSMDSARVSLVAEWCAVDTINRVSPGDLHANRERLFEAANKSAGTLLGVGAVGLIGLLYQGKERDD